MRKIKFRAWDTEQKEMLYYSPLTYTHSYRELCAKRYTEDWIDDTVANDNLLHIMQYTGLVDVNEKEIYEGDIVKYENKLYEVAFRGCSFVIIEGAYGAVISKLISSFPNNEISVVEICGNIYEHHELLNGETE